MDYHNWKIRKIIVISWWMRFKNKKKENNMWTCIECEHHFDNMTGDVDERMCYDCMDIDDDNEAKTIGVENE